MMRCSSCYKPADYTLLKWSLINPDKEGYIYWHLVNYTKDQDKYKTILAFQEAFDVWQLAFDRIEPHGRVIKLKHTSDFHKAHIKMFFMEPKTRFQEYQLEDGAIYTLENRWPFSGPGEVLAHRPPNKHEIHFDESEDWAKLSLRGTAVHEIGHLWDLGHSQVRGSVMGEYYQGDKITLALDDINGLSAAYSPIKRKLAKTIDPQIIIPNTQENKGCLSILGL